MTCANFRMSVYERSGRIPTEPGSGEKPSFKMFIDENGRRSLKENGKINTYEQIQSHKESVDIEYLMTRFANGDTSVLSKVQGVYGDFSDVPTSVVELQQRVVDAERLFYQLPLDIRSQFEHNPSMFFSMIGSDAFNKIMGIDATKDNPFIDTGAASPTVQPTEPTVQPTDSTVTV